MNRSEVFRQLQSFFSKVVHHLLEEINITPPNVPVINAQHFQ